MSVSLTEDQVKADRGNFDQLQNAYQACLNDTVETGEGLESLLSFINAVVTVFPAHLGSSEKSEVLSKAMGETLVIFETYGIATT